MDWLYVIEQTRCTRSAFTTDYLRMVAAHAIAPFYCGIANEQHLK